MGRGPALQMGFVVFALAGCRASSTPPARISGGGGAGGSGAPAASGGNAGPTGGIGGPGSGGAGAGGTDAGTGGIVVAGTGGIAGAGGGAAGGSGGATGGSAGAGGTPVTAATDPRWAAWPMPNSPGDAARGAPHPLSYTNNQDGTVTDNVTGLLWEQAASASDRYTWSDAVAHCPSLALRSRHDWRLPTAIELLSLVDDNQSPVAAIDTNTFPATQPYFFWTSTRVAGADDSAWVVQFDGGVPAPANRMVDLYVRCVAGGAPPPGDAGAAGGHYVVSNGTVYDTGTRLTWQQAVPALPDIWPNASTNCVYLAATLGGSGWRLPTKKELFTLIDFDVASPAPLVDATAFPGTPAGPFWSTTAQANAQFTYWQVNFGTGATTTAPYSIDDSVRCVR
jgi:Protein of unknown function (DUF1566)